jgi:hypothetical protein
MTIFAIACSIPIATLLAMAAMRCPRSLSEWAPRILTVAILFGIGLYCCGLFLRDTYVGTGEAYNYSLSIADAVTQSRSGVFPVLVGQTEFAFNGRIHPLRTAPWYCCAACLLDWATFHGLTFWQIQNAILTLSIVGAVFSAYASLRLLIRASRRVAVLGAAVFALSPSVVSTAYAMDLYMTVTALPLVPIVAAANVASFSRRSVGVYLCLGVAIGFAWLAHPPVALWLSTCTALIQAILWLTRKPSWTAVTAVVPGFVACLLLASFSFISTAAMRQVGGLSNPEDFSPLFEELSRSFPACLLPVSSGANSLSDFQLGYVDGCLLLLGLATAFARRRLGPGVLFLVAVLLILLTMPVPRFTKAIWLGLPPLYPNLTNIWPMQRLYLVATGLILAACGSLWADADARLLASPAKYRIACLAVAGALLWHVGQARMFFKRGELLRHGREESADLHRSENLNLTVTSYALLGVPAHYANGVMDPEREFRLLRVADRSELANNWSPVGEGQLRAHGELHSASSANGSTMLAPDIRVEPYKHYFLTFSFKSQPSTGFLLMLGDHFHREYPLPQAGAKRGFGMLPENDHSLDLWSTNPDGTKIRLTTVGFLVNGAFADFELRDVDSASFPVELDGLVPLAGQVRSPEEAWLETPRRYIPGYVATVDGHLASVANSPDGAVMLKVPGGTHAFQLAYKGSTMLLAGFWVSFGTGVILALAIVWRLGVSAWNQRQPPNPIPVVTVSGRAPA